MRKLLTDLDEADGRYNALPQSENGKIISTDIARFLDSRYAKEPASGKTRDMQPSWDLAWRYAQDRLEREISNRRHRRTLRLMAGGWGAGKTHALEQEPSHEPDLIWDGTLSKLTWAVDTIDLALENKWKIEIAYVYRDLELALYGAIERQTKAGRGVPIIELPTNHRSVQKAILNLTTLYVKEPDVSFVYLHNLGTEKVPAKSTTVDLFDLELNGALHYLERHEQYYAKAAERLLQK